MNEQIENLRLDRNEFSFAPQFTPRDIYFKIGEAKIQGSNTPHSATQAGYRFIISSADFG
ncbi:MAG TPA: hypothetical protein VLU23_13690 [Pseudolabrys sp.]|nr:hypothetical protein [Pseudolabrys sp.]